jgi:hypothetical protein
MTFAPPRLLELRQFFQSLYPWLSDNELGIVGGPSHAAAGTSYHLGRDQLKMSRDPYSARTRRDLNGLSNAASAFDLDDGLGGGPAELQELSRWVVGQCRQGSADTQDLREVIFSPDGVVVLTWDRQRGQSSYPLARGNISHIEHSHFSWYRDSEYRDKTAVFRRFYAERDKRGVVDMFFLKLRTEQAIWVSDGLHTRNVPGGQWDITCVPLINAGVPILEYDTMEQLLHAGGPLATETSAEPVSEEMLERVLRRVFRSVPE